MKKIAIITNDSTIMLPEIRKWKEGMGRGSEIAENTLVRRKLESANMNMPTTDLDLESDYQQHLKEYLREARLMFGGPFSEVRVFHSKVEEKYQADLFIVTGRYGLVNGTTKIIPYLVPVSDVEGVKRIESCHGISEAMLHVLSEASHSVLALPSYYMQFLIQSKWFERASELSKIIVVSASTFRRHLSPYNRIVMFDRIGVARIGKRNQTAILDLIDE